MVAGMEIHLHDLKKRWSVGRGERAGVQVGHGTYIIEDIAISLFKGKPLICPRSCPALLPEGKGENGRKPVL